MNIMKNAIAQRCLDLMGHKHSQRDSFPDFNVFTGIHGDRYVHSKDGHFNMFFRKADGFTAKWGKTFDDNPHFCPFGNEIADIEITTACRGIRDKDGKRKICPFCAPAGTMIQTPNNSIAIEKIEKGDYVIGYDFIKNRPQIQKVEETYEREYAGEIICIELEKNNILKLTPNHPVMLSDGTQVLAKDLKESDDIIIW